MSYPLGVSYVKSLETYWSAQEASVIPKCVVTPTSTKDVSHAVYILSLLSEKTSFKPECQFAIKGAGHTPWAGAANQAGGVTIDLAGLNIIDVSPDKTLTGIGPGNRWINVYSKLDLLGLAVPGGRVSSVGVGGLVTGGKYVILSQWPSKCMGLTGENKAVYHSSPPNSALFVTV